MLDRLMARLMRAAQRQRLAILAGMAVAAAVSIIFMSRLTFDADVLRLLPQQGRAVQSFQVFLRKFGSLDYLYILFEADDGIADHGDLVDAYVDELRKLPEMASVDAQLFEPGKDWGYLYDHELLLLGADHAERALKKFEPAEMVKALTETRELLSVPSSDVKAYVQQDPLGLLALLRDRFSREQGIGGGSFGENGYISADGRGRLVLARPARPPFDTDFSRALLSRLADVERRARARTASTDAEGAAAVRIQPAGGYRVAVEAEALIRRESVVNAVGGSVVLLALIFVLFRTPRILLYGSLPIAMAVLLTLGVSGLRGLPLSPATSGTAAMLFGLGIDGVILFYLRFMEESRRGLGAVEAIGRLGGTAASILIAQLTTAATFFALLLIDFPSLADLGRLVGLGMIFCCACTLLLLPALVSFGSPDRLGRRFTTPWLGRFVARYRRPIVVAAVLATVVSGVAAVRLRLNTTLERLEAQTPGMVLERQLAERFSLPHDVLLAVAEGPDLERLLTIHTRLTAALADRLPGVTVASPLSLLPARAAQDDVAGRLRRASLDVETVRTRLDEASRRAGFRPGSFEPFIARLPGILNTDQRLTYSGFIDHGLESIISRFIVRRDGAFATVAYLYPRSGETVEQIADVVGSVDQALTLTGVPAVNREISRVFLPEFLKGVVIGTVAVALINYVGFRSVGLTLLSLVPMTIGFVWSAGFLAVTGFELDLFSLFAAITYIGVAVDYGTYMLYRYYVENERDMIAVLSQTGAAIVLACGTALIGFGSLLTSSYGPLRSFGIVSVVTLIASVIASLVVVPAFLMRPHRAGTRASGTPAEETTR
jgi:predicted RND superfamily exporter protein